MTGDTVKESFEILNGKLKELGLFPIELVNPKDCIPQKMNARYFDAETFNQLVSNIKSDGALESAPLLFQDAELKKKGKYEIISGHHRVDAAKAAGFTQILAFVRTDITRDELVSKQLSHNALTGKDDQAVLKELFDSITDIDLKLATGLQDDVLKVAYEALNFKVGTFKTFTIMFTPPDFEDYEKIVGELVESANITGTETEVRLASMDDNPKFIEAIQRIKKTENIKSNAVAFHRLLLLAEEGLKKLEVDKAEKDKELALQKAEEKSTKPKSKPKPSVFDDI